MKAGTRLKSATCDTEVMIVRAGEGTLECGGSPMNMNWASWRNSHGMDTVLSGSVVTTSAGLLGAGPTLGLPIGDPRRVQLGHLYLGIESNDSLFRDGFQAGQ